MSNEIDINKPIMPYINCDGYYTQCPHDWTEFDYKAERCPKCGQLIDWSWLEEIDNDKKKQVRS